MIYILSDLGERSTARPIGAYRIATALRKSGYQVEVIDFLSEWSVEELLAYIDAGPKPLWIGFSTTFISVDKRSWADAAENQGSKWANELTRFKEDDLYFFNELKKRSILIAGGSRADRVKYFYEFDYVFAGYADEAVVAFSDFISGKTDQFSYEDENILSLKESGKSYNVKRINCQEYYVVKEVDDIGTEYVDTDFIEEGEELPLEISRGCIFKCSFCAYPLNGKTKNDYIRPKEEILKDIKTYQEKYKSNVYYFLDDTFNDTVEKLEMIKDIRNQLNPFKFWAYGRLDLIRARPETIPLMKEIGWDWVTFGVETFNKTAGSLIGKSSPKNNQEQTLIDLKTQNPDLYINLEFIVGLPGDTPEDNFEIVSWLLDNQLLWDEVRFKGLSIDDQRFYPWQSKFSADPEKYGIQVINFTEKYYRPWKHQTSDYLTASRIAKEIEDIVRNKTTSGELKSSSPLRSKSIRASYWEIGGITSTNLHEYYSGDANLALKTRIKSRGYRYKRNKLATRGLEVTFNNVEDFFKKSYFAPWHMRILEILKKTDYKILPENYKKD